MYVSIKQKRNTEKMASMIHSNISMESYFQRCVQNMYAKIKEHGLQEAFLNVNGNQEEFKKTGAMFNQTTAHDKLQNINKGDKLEITAYPAVQAFHSLLNISERFALE